MRNITLTVAAVIVFTASDTVPSLAHIGASYSRFQCADVLTNPGGYSGPIAAYCYGRTRQGRHVMRTAPVTQDDGPSTLAP